MANSILHNLTEITAPDPTDLLYLEHDPSGTPADRKLQLYNAGVAGFPLPLLSPLVRPDNSLFAWINQGATADVTVNTKTLFLYDTFGNSTEQVRLRKKAAPGSTPYTITMAFTPMANTNCASFNAGIAFRAGSNPMLTYGFMWSVGWTVFVKEWNSPTSAGSSVLTGTLQFAPTPFLWCRVVDDGTNHKFYISPDGINWSRQLTRGRTATLTATEVGFYINNVNGGNVADLPAGIIIPHWTVA